MTTPNLQLPEWVQDQNQPHVPVDLSLRILDCLCQLRVLDRDLTAPPGSPQEGDCYIPDTPATGAWDNHENDVAMYIGGAWIFRTPLDGWEGYLVDESIRIRFDGASSPGFWISTEST